MNLRHELSQPVRGFLLIHSRRATTWLPIIATSLHLVPPFHIPYNSLRTRLVYLREGMDESRFESAIVDLDRGLDRRDDLARQVSHGADNRKGLLSATQRNSEIFC